MKPDKIRIFWIDDCEGWKQDKVTPSLLLPEELAKHFEIIRYDKGLPSTAPTRIDFFKVLRTFFEKDLKEGRTDRLPAEIIVMDYNLSKFAPAGDADYKTSNEDPSLSKNDYIHESHSGEDTNYRTIDRETPADYEFEGLVLGTFYASMTLSHPAGVVPITSYKSLAEEPVVQSVHDLYQTFLGVDFRNFIVRGEQRSWEKVLRLGVKALQDRIRMLYQAGNIVVSPSDLMSLIDRPGEHGVLTIRSQFAMRRLPTQGLFIDVPENKRAVKIEHWARDLLEVAVNYEDLKSAQELAGMVWDCYKNNKPDLVESRKNLSLLMANKAQGRTVDEKELERLSIFFKVTGKQCKDRCVDIFSGRYSGRVRRWAALLVTLKLLKRLIRVKKRFEDAFSKIKGTPPKNPEGPFLATDDLYLALFPSPGTPLVLPWHEGKIIDKSFGWAKSMMRLKDKATGEKLSLHLPDMLAGEGWFGGGQHGLRHADRLILQGFALEDENLTEADWRSYGPARRILWGNENQGTVK